MTIRKAVFCDVCDKEIKGPFENKQSYDGFTDRPQPNWPDDLWHLCGYCTFKAKVAYVKP